MPWCPCCHFSYSEQRCSKLTLLAYPFFLIILLLSFYIRYMWIPLIIFSSIFICLACGDWNGNTGVRRNLTRRGANSTAIQSEITIPVAVAANLSVGGVGVHQIPSFEFDRKNGSSGELVCSVCLEVLQDGEIVRQLPECQHLFHCGCIDMWLGSHSTCPLCRSSVEVAKTANATEMSQSSAPERSEQTEPPANHRLPV